VEVIADWRATTDAFEGDACWEQNALNAILREDLGDALVLDARIWNMHGALIDLMNDDQSDFRCDGVQTIFAHAASGIIGHMDEGPMDLRFGEYVYHNSLKLFRHAALRAQQMEYMNAFVGNHFDLLTKGDIFRRA
jgi:hypothetical protein